ncbi:MAG: DUF2336 domain-containing protein [Emcibacter sp.]|nr:DUF2336 domain-containing protein [Emcibacter sp.]
MTLEQPNLNEKISNILQLSYVKNTEGRSLLFNKITDFLEEHHTELSQTEQTLMSEILDKLLNNVEMTVRKKLAERLAMSEEAPLDLIVLLANDQIDVALPVLELSKLLSDSELINVIRHKTAQHQLSIASRQKLSSNVCRELVTVGNTKTLLVMLNNHDAKIDNSSFADLIEKSKDVQPLQPPIIERPDLPPEMAAKMYQWVSHNLKQSILTNLDLNESDIDEILLTTIEEVANGGANQVTSEKSEIILVNKLYQAKKLSPAFLMKCLNQGQSSLFEIAFAKMIKVPRKIMRSFLYNRGADALAVSCCAAGIDQSVFLTIFQLTRAAQNIETEISDDETAKAFEHFKRLDKKKAHVTIQKWVAEATGSSIF